MQASPAYTACMKKQASGTRRRFARSRGEARPAAASSRAAQYTVRGVPAHVDKALRVRARREQVSLSELLRRALAREAGVAADAEVAYDDLDHLAGRWHEDRGFDRAIAAQDRVDEDLWR